MWDMDTPEQRAKILEAEVQAFKKYLGTVPPGDFDRSSACEGWSVADVVAHLVGQDFALRVTRGLQGDSSPPEGAPDVADHDEDRFAQNIFDRAHATREQHGDCLVAALGERLDETVAVFNGVPAGQWDNLCYWPPGPEPVRTLLDMRISELTMHAWDIGSVLGAGYHLSAEAVAVLFDTVDRAVRRAFRPDPSLEKPIRHRFILSGTQSAEKDIVVAASGATVGPAGAETPDVTFLCDGETYVLAMYGRVGIDAAIADGRLRFEGDAVLATGFGRRFVGG